MHRQAAPLLPGVGIRGVVARALCLLVLPFAVVAATTQAAEAATHYGNVAPISHTFGDSEFGGVAIDVMRCDANVYYAVPDGGSFTTVKGKGVCSDGWSVNLDEGASSVHVSFTGFLEGTTTPCTLSDTTGSTNLSGWDFTVNATNIGGLCAVTQACWSAVVKLNLAPDEAYSNECEDVDLGEIPGHDVVQECERGNVVAVSVEHDRPNSRARVHLVWSGTPAIGSLFIVRVYAAAQTALSPPNTYASADLDVAAGDPVTEWMNWPWPEHTGGGISVLPRNFSITPAVPTSAPTTLEGPASAGPPTGPKGYTNRYMCAWWFGPKIYDDPDTTYDTPAGDLSGEEPEGDNTTDPDPAPPESVNACEFSLSNPTTWISSGICKLVGLIDRLISVVGSLPGKIAAAIGSLFQPEDGYLEDKFGEVQDAMGDTAPGKWLAALDLDTGSVSGCEGMPLNVDMPGDVEINEHLGAACDGPAASAASLVKIALSVVLVVAGAMTCLRAVGSGFGWSPKGGDA